MNDASYLMSNSRKRLGELLVDLKLITPVQLEEAVEAQKERAEHLGKVLVRKGYLTEDLLLNALAAQYGCLLYTSPSPRDGLLSRMPSSA